MIKINKIIFASMLLLGAGCTTVKKFLGIEKEEQSGEIVEVVEGSAPEPVDIGVNLSTPQTHYTEFLIVCLLVILGLCLLRHFLNKK